VATPRIVAGRYELLREVARGGMAIVYEAVHVVSRRRVALKVLFTAAFADDMSRARFLREVSAPARIGHEGIVEIFDAGFNDEDGAPFVAMELLAGHTLRQVLDGGPPLLARTLALFTGLLAPMEAAHAVGIVHRDLKPENVFVTQRNGVELVKVLDFGLARTVDERAEKETRTGVAMGTPRYMAPEQAVSARDVTPAADVWALGVMLYEAISGRTPFEGPTPSAIVVEAVTQPHVPLNHLAPQTPMALVTLVDRCLQKEPSQRPRDAGALLAEMTQLRASLGLAATALGQASFVASGPSAAELSLPPTAAMAVTPPPFDSPLVTPSRVTPPMSTPMMTPPGSTPGVPFGGPTAGVTIGGPTPPAASGSNREGTLGLMLGAGIGLLLLLFVGAAGGAVYLFTRDQSSGPELPREGDLAPGDVTLPSGEYFDPYEFDWPVGTRVHLELHSAQFDPYLIAKPPDGPQLDNDDAAQGDSAAGLDFTVSAGGRWRVVATSFRAGEVGHYQLTITTQAAM